MKAGDSHNTNLEPGILPIFRLFAIVRIVTFVLTYGIQMVMNINPQGLDFKVYITVGLIEMFVLVIFLYVPWLQRRLNEYYFPVAIVIAFMGTVIERYYGMWLLGITDINTHWHPLTFIFVPLVLIAWQYDFHKVVIFSLGTALFEIIIGIVLSSPEIANTLFFNNMLIFLRTVAFLFVGYMVSQLVDVQREQHQALLQANLKLVQYASTIEQLTVSRERNRLARELHDTLAHTLSALAVHLDAIATLWNPAPEKAAIMLDKALTIIRSGLDETRRALHDLRASPLEEMGLVLAIRALAEDFSDRCNLTLKLKLPDDLPGLLPEIEQCYYRVAQEALENTTEHANAKTVLVSLDFNNKQLIMCISDDGVGFSPEKILSNDSFGLKGMRERADLIGAVLEVESEQNLGTTVRLTKEII